MPGGRGGSILVRQADLTRPHRTHAKQNQQGAHLRASPARVNHATLPACWALGVNAAAAALTSTTAPHDPPGFSAEQVNWVAISPDDHDGCCPGCAHYTTMTSSWRTAPSPATAVLPPRRLGGGACRSSAVSVVVLGADVQLRVDYVPQPHAEHEGERAADVSEVARAEEGADTVYCATYQASP